MIELSIRRNNDQFISYEYRATVTVTTRLSERKQRKLGLSDVLGVHSFVLKTPVADIDFMVEIAMRHFSVKLWMISILSVQSTLEEMVTRVLFWQPFLPG